MGIEKKNNKTASAGLLYDIKKYKNVYVLLLPAILLVFVFAYLPMAGIIIAFQEFDILKGFTGSPWVGFDNFKKIFVRPDMLVAIKNTLINGIVILFGAFPFPIILALLFNELRCMRFKKIVQTITYMPYFLSWISVIGLFYSLLATEGTINQILGSIIGESFKGKNILLDSNYFLPIIFGSHLWKNVGWSSVVFLAAIAGVDQALYEAAAVDGCGKLRQVFSITIPCIKGTIVIVLIMSLGTLVNANFEQVYGLQNIYTQEATETINTLIYRLGILNGKYSLSTAFGLAQGLVSLTLMLIANGISKKSMGTSIW